MKEKIVLIIAVIFLLVSIGYAEEDIVAEDWKRFQELQKPLGHVNSVVEEAGKVIEESDKKVEESKKKKEQAPIINLDNIGNW